MIPQQKVNINYYIEVNNQYSFVDKIANKIPKELLNEFKNEDSVS